MATEKREQYKRLAALHTEILKEQRNYRRSQAGYRRLQDAADAIARYRSSYKNLRDDVAEKTEIAERVAAQVAETSVRRLGSDDSWNSDPNWMDKLKAAGVMH